jgi:hypothetical protein
MAYLTGRSDDDSGATVCAIRDGALTEAIEPTAANGCDRPCPHCTSYYTCIVAGRHDGPHYCDHGHT